MSKSQISQDKLIQLIKEGLSYTEINNLYKVSYSTIQKVCKEHNLKIVRKQSGGKNIKDLTKEPPFGALTVISRNYDKHNNQLAYWNCNCLCGNTFIACGSDLRQGKTKSCGCRTSIKTKRNWQGFGYIPKSYWSCCNRNASQRNLEFTITIEYINNLFIKQNFKCALSGVDISFKDSTASLDRIDSSKGYIKGNLQWIHKNLQSMKNDKTDKYFITWCNKVSDYNRSKN